MAIQLSPLSLQRASNKAAIAAANTANALMKTRIFNRGGAVNSKIGKYRSRSYRKKRIKAGRQTGYKDLEFDGDLRRPIQTGERSTGAVIGFTNDAARNIAVYQEEQTGKDIFGLAKTEIETAKKTFIKSYRARIAKK